MKKKLINALLAYTTKKVELYKAQKRAVLDSVSQEIPNIVELEKKDKVWSVSVNGERASNMIIPEDERQLLRSVGVTPRMSAAKTRVSFGEDGQTLTFGYTNVNRGSTSIFGGVTTENYKKLQKATKKIQFWEKVRAKLLSF